MIKSLKLKLEIIIFIEYYYLIIINNMNFKDNEIFWTFKEDKVTQNIHFN